MRTGAALLAALAITLPIRAQDETDSALTFTTLSGKSITPLRAPGGKPSVVVFITVDCPIANAYAPEINRIHATFAKRGVPLTLVHVDPDLTVHDARKHAADYALKPEIVIDPEHRLVAATRATITPEAAVCVEGGKPVYLGRINNLYTGLGDRRNNVTAHDLRDAIEAVLAGKPVPHPRVEAIGCSIPDLD